MNKATLAPEEQTDRKGNWIRVYSGRKYYPLDPREEEVHLGDIAHSLSMLCRYNGHVNKFYSVAEHCYILSKIVPPEYALEALLHDASEAYMSDIPRPLKYSDELKLFREIEDLNTACINRKYGLPETTSPLVKEYDSRIVTNEKKVLFDLDWNEGLEPLEDVEIKNWSPNLAKKMYLYRVIELT